METLTTDIGSRIKEAREQRGLTVRDIADTTKIAPSALNAIERNDFARLPGGVYSRAYLRAFATEVGLDPDELTREYRAGFESDVDEQPPPPRKAQWLDHVRPVHLVLTVLLAAGFLVGGSAILKRPDVAPASSDEPVTLAAVEADRQQDPVPRSAREATADAAFAAKAAVSDAGARSLQLEIRFIRSCWVSAWADGTRVVYRLMQPGERALVDARRAITLRLGDAGAVDYSLNGVTGRPLGSDGEAVTVRITGDGLQMTSITSRQDERLTSSM